MAGKLSLVPHIKQNGVIASLIRSICALPLLPTEQIEEGLEAIGRRALRLGHFDLLEPLFVKVASTWLTAKVLEVLSVCDAVDRTSNACESDNSSLARAVKTCHPSIWRFLSEL